MFGLNHDLSLSFGETEQVDETLNYEDLTDAIAVDPVA